MAYFINVLSTAVTPYVMPVVEKNLAPDFLVRFGECQQSRGRAHIEIDPKFDMPYKLSWM